MKFFKSIIMIGIMIGISLQSNAQSAMENYNSAKTFFENGNSDKCLSYLQNSQTSLGGSNAKIESLKCQALIMKSDWVNAAIAYTNYERLLPTSAKSGDAYSMMLENKKEIWNQLEQIEKKKKEEKEKELRDDLAMAEREADAYEMANTAKENQMNANNEQHLYEMAMQSKDKELLDLYKEEIGTTGDNFKKIETEIDKQNNPTSFLFSALKIDDLNDFKYLISLGADLKWKNQKGESLIHLAIINDAYKIFEELNNHAIDIEQVDFDGNTPLIKAIINNKVKFFELLLVKGASLTNVNSATQQSPFYYALIYTNTIIGKKMIDKGIDPNQYFTLRNEKYTPLFLATHQTKSIEYMDFLIKNGANINLVSENGMTPLMAAVENERLDLVNFLLNNGANINIQNQSKQTALHLAVLKENQDMVLYLIQRGGANKKIKDSLKNTPLNLSKNIGNKEISKIIKKNKSYIDISSNFTYHENQYLLKAEKIKNWKAIVDARKDRLFLTYAYDSICKYGMSIGTVNQRGVGFYVTLRANDKILKSAGQNGTVDNNGVVTGGQFENWGNDWRFKNKTSSGVAEGLIGLTKKITYPLWIYAGAGLSYSQAYWQMDLFDNNGDYYQTDWLKNSDEENFKPVFESGFIIDLKGFNIRGGVKTQKIKDINLTLGIGFSIL